MDTSRLLNEPLDELTEMLERFQRADDATQRQLFLRIGDHLVAHTPLEERRCCPSMDVSEREDERREAVEEYLLAKRRLADLRT